MTRGRFTQRGTVTRLTSSGSTRDEYGAPTATWATVGTIACTRVSSLSSKALNNPDRPVIASYECFCVIGSAVAERDHVTVNGVEYEVKAVSGNPGGVSSHMELLLEVAS